jgi:hypothetical protein
MRKNLFVLFAVALMFGAVPMFGEVLWTPQDGGFIGKGDVQLVLGLNNKQMQSTPVNFTFEELSIAERICRIPQSDETSAATKTLTKSQSVNATVVTEARLKNQMTGWFGAPVDADGAGDPGEPALCSHPFSEQVGIVTYTSGDPVLKVNGVLLKSFADDDEE